MDPRLAQEIQVPIIPTMEETAELEGEGLSEQMIAVLENELMNLNEEIVMVTENTDAEAFKPSSLSEPKCCLDWFDWEHALAKELNILHEAGTWEIIKPPPGAILL